MTTVEQQIATSVLVIGTGGSGLRAAIELAERGIDVLIVGKRPKADAHTTLAAGGINAALATMDAADTWQQHAADTLTESYLLADPRTVQIVTEGAAESIGDVERWGLAFAREKDGRIFSASSVHTPSAAPLSLATTPAWNCNARSSGGRNNSPSPSSIRLTSPSCLSVTTSSSVHTDSIFRTAPAAPSTRMPSYSLRVGTLGYGGARPHDAMKIPVTLSVWPSKRVGGSAIRSWFSFIRPG